MRTQDSLTTALILLLLSFPALGLAQDSAPPPENQAASPAISVTKPRLKGTLRLIAIKKDGQEVTDLKAEDLRLLVNNQDRKILSVSSTASLPKTIGIFLDGTYFRGFDVLVGKEMGTIISILKSVWREHDVGYVVSFSDKIYKDIPPTDDLAQIEKAFPKILSRDFDRPLGWNSGWVYRWPHMRQYGNMSWYDALSSASLSVPQTVGGEKIYIILSDLIWSKIDNSATKAILNQRARIFPLLVFPDPAFYFGDGYFNDCVDCNYELAIWKGQKTAEKIAKRTGGELFTVSRREDLARAQRLLTSELQGAYLVDYEPSQGSATENIKIVCKRHHIRLLYPRD